MFYAYTHTHTPARTHTHTHTHTHTDETLISTLCSLTSKQKRCKSNNGSTSDKIVVIGALSFLGSRLIPRLLLDHNLDDIIAVAQDNDIVATNELLWYRKDQLFQHHGVSVQFTNFSNHTQLQRSLFGEDDKRINLSILVYFAPGMDTKELENSGKGVNSNDMQSVYLSEFVTVLEELRQTSPCTKVVLVTESASSSVRPHDSHMIPPNGHMTIKQGWMRTFELMLSTYHNLYGLPITLFSVGGTHGPWSHISLDLQNQLNNQGNTLSTNEWSELIPKLCWYVEDVMDTLLKAMSSQKDCIVLDIGGCQFSENSSVSHSSSLEQLLDSADEALQYILSDKVKQSWQLLNISAPMMRGTAVKKSLRWARSYQMQRTTSNQKGKEKNVVFTSYFTSTEDSQRYRHIKPNRFEYMKDWTLSLKEQKMEAVVFHDGLDAGFQHRVSQFYSNVSFEYVESLKNRSTNDARFYAYLDYLERHTDVDRVLLTDISDVRFQLNPFELMSLLGDLLYIGTDIDIFPTMATMQWIHERLRGCFGNFSVDHGDLSKLMEQNTVYNAGTIGGSRDVVLAALSRIVEYLNLTPTQLNCNMPAVNYAVHKHFYDSVFTGYPLNSRFLRRQASPKGVYIIHK